MIHVLTPAAPKMTAHEVLGHDPVLSRPRTVLRTVPSTHGPSTASVNLESTDHSSTHRLYSSTMVKDKQAEGKLDKYVRCSPTRVDSSSLSGATERPKSSPECPNLQAISELHTSIGGKSGELHVNLSLIRQDLRNMVDLMTE